MVEAAAEPVASGRCQPPSRSRAASRCIVLAANCSVKDAAALKVSLCAVANESTAVTLDASAVERVDTATMQLLCAFVRDRSGRNQRVTWRGESQALQDAARLLGVRALLGFESKRSCRMTRILAVDDSPSMRDMVRIALTSAGFDVTSAGDGQEALDIARKRRVSTWCSPTSTCR